MRGVLANWPLGSPAPWLRAQTSRTCLLLHQQQFLLLQCCQLLLQRCQSPRVFQPLLSCGCLQLLLRLADVSFDIGNALLYLLYLCHPASCNRNTAMHGQ
jgi:hypothetical protein